MDIYLHTYISSFTYAGVKLCVGCVSLARLTQLIFSIEPTIFFHSTDPTENHSDSV